LTTPSKGGREIAVRPNLGTERLAAEFSGTGIQSLLHCAPGKLGLIARFGPRREMKERSSRAIAVALRILDLDDDGEFQGR
jgi:hypothetical protein